MANQYATGDFAPSKGMNAPGGTKKRAKVPAALKGSKAGKSRVGKRTKTLKMANGITSGIMTPPPQ